MAATERRTRTRTRAGREGRRREMLGPRAGGERITYNTRRVREVEEKGEAETREVHRDPLQDRV